jgi:hypothetical protein
MVMDQNLLMLHNLMNKYHKNNNYLKLFDLSIHKLINYISYYFDSIH